MEAFTLPHGHSSRTGVAGGTSAESEAASQPAASDSVLVSPKRHTSRRIKARPAVEEQAPETEPEEADTEE